MMERNVGQMLRFLAATYKRHAKRILLILLLLAVAAGLNMFMPRLSASIIDDGLVPGDADRVLSLALIILLIGAGIHVVQFLIEMIRLNGFNEVQTRLKEKALDKLLHVDYTFFHLRSATEVYQQIDEDIQAISGCFSPEILMALVQIFVSAALIPVLVGISWKLTLVMLLAVPLDLLKSMLFTRMGYRISREGVEARTKYSSWLADVVTGIGTIRCFGLASHFSFLFQMRQTDVVNAQYKQGMIQQAMIRMELLFADLLTFAVYVIGGYLIAGKELSIGSFIAFQTYSVNIISFIGQFMNVVFGIAMMRPSVERYMDFLEEKEESLGEEETIIELDSLELDNVCFSYTMEDKLIKDMNLTIRPGEHIVLQGENGCGKTTLINLLLRLYHPDSGEIRVNGHNVDKIGIHRYRELFTMASQTPYLFCDTIKNNICLYHEVPEERLAEALERVGLTEVVKEKGLDYVVGQNGCELSGGQRQRLSIARTLVSDAPVVIMDEPETNLDREFEELFRKIMKESFADRTVIMISHRTRYAALMDHAYRFADSRLVPMDVPEAADEDRGH